MCYPPLSLCFVPPLYCCCCCRHTPRRCRSTPVCCIKEPALLTSTRHTPTSSPPGSSCRSCSETSGYEQVPCYTELYCAGADLRLCSVSSPACLRCLILRLCVCVPLICCCCCWWCPTERDHPSLIIASSFTSDRLQLEVSRKCSLQLTLSQSCAPTVSLLPLYID